MGKMQGVEKASPTPPKEGLSLPLGGRLEGASECRKQRSRWPIMIHRRLFLQQSALEPLLVPELDGSGQRGQHVVARFDGIVKDNNGALA